LPVGIFIFTLNNQNNIELGLKYPESLRLSNNLFKIIDLSHEFKDGQNFSSILIGNSKIASLYTGSKFINLLLDNGEKPATFENPLLYYSKKISRILSIDERNKVIEQIFNQISEYPSFDEEQKLAFAYSDEIKHLIMQKLIDSAFISKKDLLIWLNETASSKIRNIDAALNTLKELGLLQISFIDESSDEFVFCTGDVFVTRVPPAEIVLKIENQEFPEKISLKYMSDLNDFFKNYSPTSKDAKDIIEIICDYNSYHNLKLLRISPATKKGLMKVGKATTDLDSVLERFLQKQVIKIIKDDNNNEFYFLLTDLRLQKFFPEYLLKKILDSYNNQSVPNSILTENLILLKETYESELKRIKEEEEKQEREE